MSIPKGRFLWNATTGNIKNLVKPWNGITSTFDNSPEGLGAFSIPPVTSDSGLILLCNAGDIIFKFGITPKGDLKYTRYLASWYLNREQENYSIQCGYYGSYGYYYYYWGERHRWYLYQSYGSNIYTINAYSEGAADPRNNVQPYAGTLCAVVAKGTQKSTGLPTTLFMYPKSPSDRSVIGYDFLIWDPENRNWISGTVTPITQDVIDSSHVMISPMELNGYSFPNLFLADGKSSKAFGAYCDLEEIKNYKYFIKKVKISGDMYYIPISHVINTILLINKAPDDITIDH